MNNIPYAIRTNKKLWIYVKSNNIKPELIHYNTFLCFDDAISQKVHKFNVSE